MANLLRWSEPKDAVRCRWRNEALPLCRREARAWLKWMPLLGLPALATVWIWAPEHGPRVALALLTCGAMLPAYGYLDDWMRYHLGSVCVVSRRGVYKHRALWWRDVAGWAIGAHPELPHVRRLFVKARYSDRLFTFDFDPRQVSEEELRAVLNRFAPRSTRDLEAQASRRAATGGVT